MATPRTASQRARRQLAAVRQPTPPAARPVGTYGASTPYCGRKSSGSSAANLVVTVNDPSRGSGRTLASQLSIVLRGCSAGRGSVRPHTLVDRGWDVELGSSWGLEIAVRTAISRPQELPSSTSQPRSTSVCGRTEPLPAEQPRKTIDSWDARVRPDPLEGSFTVTTRFAALLPELLRPQYGVEAPYVPTGLAAGGVGCLTAASWRRARWLAVLGVAMFAQAGLYLHTTVRGKLRVWERELDRLNLRGDERLLDLGCGRGAVLIAAA